MEYKIEVLMNPHTWDNKTAPYFWVIFGCVQGGDWFNEGCGWAKSPEQAWQDANKYFNRFKKDSE